MAVPSLSPEMSKPELRAAMREARKAFLSGLTTPERVAMERSLHAQIKPLLDSAQLVGAYLPVGSEIDPLGAEFDMEKTAFPAFSSDPDDKVFRFRLGPPIAVGPHGVPQPGPMDPEVMPDLVLVPLIAIDPKGFRLGQGGGHYDRALQPLKERGSRFIGLGWPLQRIDFALPAEAWDIPLDGFASPLGLEMFA